MNEAIAFVYLFFFCSKPLFLLMNCFVTPFHKRLLHQLLIMEKQRSSLPLDDFLPTNQAPPYKASLHSLPHISLYCSQRKLLPLENKINRPMVKYGTKKREHHIYNLIYEQSFFNPK